MYCHRTKIGNVIDLGCHVFVNNISNFNEAKYRMDIKPKLLKKWYADKPN